MSFEIYYTLFRFKKSKLFFIKTSGFGVSKINLVNVKNFDRSMSHRYKFGTYLDDNEQEQK